MSSPYEPIASLEGPIENRPNWDGPGTVNGTVFISASYRICESYEKMGRLGRFLSGTYGWGEISLAVLPPKKKKKK